MIVIDPNLMARLHREAAGCEYCEGLICKNLGLQAHHIRARGMDGGSRLDTGFNVIILGVTCHDAAQRYRIDPQKLHGIAAQREVRRILRERDTTKNWWEV